MPDAVWQACVPGGIDNCKVYSAKWQCALCIMGSKVDITKSKCVDNV